MGLENRNLPIFSFPQHSRPNFTRKRDTRSENLEIPINVVLPQVGVNTVGCNLSVLAGITLLFPSPSKILQNNVARASGSSCRSAASQRCAGGEPT